MAGKIEIFKLDIDIDAVISKTSELKKQTEDVKKGLDSLKKSGDTSSETYVKMKAAYDDLNGQYRSSQQELTKLVNLQGKEIKTVTEARNALAVVKKEWADQAKLYGENSKAAEDLANKKLELTERLKELESATGDNTRNVGNYTESVKEALGSVNIFNNGLGGLISKMKESGGAGNVLKGALTGATKGFLNMTKAAFSFIATPIGALLAILVGAFTLVKTAMSRSEEATNKIQRAFAGFQGIINTLMKFLEPLGDFLIDGLVKGFELVEKGIYKALDAIASGLELLGFDDSAASLRSFNQEVQQGAADAKNLADATVQLEKSQRKARLTQLEYQKEAETFRQIRDDENKSIQERIKANEDLGKVLEKQLSDELAIAKQALQVANLRIQAEGSTKETLDAQAEALTEIADIEERINGQRSEQLTNRVSLQKEAADKAHEIADKAIKDQQEQLNLFIQQQGIRAKTLQEQLDIAKEVYQREVEILDANLKNRNITQTKYDTELLKLKNELARQQAELTTDNAKRELDDYIANHQSKLDQDTFFSEETLRIERERLNGIAEARKEFAATQLQEGIINQQQYNDAINVINEENRKALEEAQAERNEAEKEKQTVDLENKRLAEEELFENDLALSAERLETQRQLEIQEAAKTGASIELINKKYAAYRTSLEKQVADAKIEANQQSFNAIAGLLGQESNIGKIAAVAAIVNNTIQESTKAFNTAAVLASNPFTAALAPNAYIQGGIIIATGAANVAKTVAPKFSEGGLLDIGGNRHYAGGTKFYGEDGSVFEAEQGELIGVMNRRAAMMFKSFNDEYRGNSTSTRNYLAGGGFVQTSTIGRNVPSINQSNIDYAAMARYIGEEVAQANLNLPTPVVTVEDINAGQSSYARVVNRADL